MQLNSLMVPKIKCHVKNINTDYKKNPKQLNNFYEDIQYKFLTDQLLGQTKNFSRHTIVITFLSYYESVYVESTV